MTTNTSEVYQREAERLLSQITTMTDDARQLELLQMARQYIKMAHRAEAREKRAAGDSETRPSLARGSVDEPRQAL